MVVDGRCFSAKIGNLLPGSARSVRVKPCGESSIHTKFRVGGTTHETSDLGYIEASSFYSEELVIKQDFTVRYFER